MEESIRQFLLGGEIHSEEDTVIESCGLCVSSRGDLSSRCNLCQKLYHRACLQHNRQPFYCPLCLIYLMEPMSQVVSTAVYPTLERLVSIPPQKMGTLLQVRCLRLDDKNEDQCWPDKGKLFLDGKIVMDFVPLEKMRAQKKRKDVPYTFEVKQEKEILLEVYENQMLTSDDYRVKLGDQFLVAVYAVNQINWAKACNIIIEDTNKWLPVRDCKEVIKNYLKSYQLTQDISLNSYKLTLTCPYDFALQITPVRGTLCSHIQTFSLENFMKIQKDRKCPHCKKKCIDLVIDSYQYLMLDFIRSKGQATEYVLLDEEGELLENQPISTEVKEAKEVKEVKEDTSALSPVPMKKVKMGSAGNPFVID